MANMQKIVIGLFGCGTIGSGVVKLIRKGIGGKYGLDIKIKTIVDINPSIPRYAGIRYSKDFNDILQDKEIDIGIELIGGYEPAFSIQKNILRSGKHLVTANKAVLSRYSRQIFRLAKEKDRFVGFEASVCGSIPIIQVINRCMPNKINTIMGIFNGSTNYILNQMEEKEYDLALKEAQQKGFAERNPDFDVKGLDSAQKLAIISGILKC